MKRIITLILVLVMLLGMIGCGGSANKPEPTATPEPTPEPIKHIPIEKWVCDGVVVKNTTTRKSLTWACPVEDALAAFETPSISSTHSNSKYYYIYSDNPESDFVHNNDCGISVTDYVDGRGNSLGCIDDIFVYSDEWVLNDILRVGMSVDDVKAAFGEPDEDVGYQFYYYFSDPVLADYKITVTPDKETNTVKSYGVHSKFFDLDGFTIYAYDVPRYVADGYFTIVSCYTSEPNSADGVDFVISFTNDSDKRIKYFTATVTPYNAVDDVVFSKTDNESTKSFELVGPIEPHSEIQTVAKENAWYNGNVKYVKIEEIKIIYMDGDQETLYFAPNW